VLIHRDSAINVILLQVKISEVDVGRNISRIKLDRLLVSLGRRKAHRLEHERRGQTLKEIEEGDNETAHMAEAVAMTIVSGGAITAEARMPMAC
jgi:hypothetical protein